jgi:hypothetical protein
MSNVYSFKNCNASLVGPGGVAVLGNGAAAAEEGITVEATEDKNTMTIGADGRGQHSLIASDAATVTVRLLKTSPINAILMIMYDLQTSSSALHGQNVITIVDAARGDTTILQSCAFKKKPTLTYAKEAGMNEWVFDCIKANTVLGV